eukprot:216815-Amphidinium_carterae.1
MRALLTLDAKLRGKVKKIANDKVQLVLAFQAAAKRWNMDLGTLADQSSSAGRETQQAGEWQEQRRKKPQAKEQSKRVVELCPSAWTHQL